MTLFKRMLSEKERLEKEIHTIEQELSSAPEGCLVCHKNGKRFKYYHKIPNRNDPANPVLHYLRKKDLQTIRVLAEKSILWNKKRDLCHELNAVCSYLDKHNPDFGNEVQRLLNSPGIQQILLPDENRFSDNITEWQHAPYEKSSDHPDHLIYPTLKGDKVRSKSEMMIAHELFTNHIPYRYECRLDLPYEFYYPDFTILHPDAGFIILWEHFGMMHDEQYVKKTARKIKTYIENGFIPGQNLIMTFESENHPFDYREIIDIIARYFQ